MCYFLVNNLVKFLLVFVCLFSIGMLKNVHANHSSNIRFHSLTSADGLPSQSVYSTFQQRNGFIWFATDRGASRYDGKSFRNFFYSPGAPNHITNNFVLQILEDDLGNIWIITEYGLNKVMPNGDIEHFLHDDNPDSINSNWLHFIYQDSSNRIWIGTNEGLNLYKPETNNFSRIEGKIKDTPFNIAVYRMIEISEDNFILGTKDGIAFFNPSDQRFMLEVDQKNDIPEWYKDTIYEMKRSKTGRILIGTDNQGLIDFDPESHEFTQYKVELDAPSIVHNNINSIVEGPKGEIWLGHYNFGLTLVSSDRQTFTSINARDFDETSLISNVVNHLFEDQSGLLWVSTMQGVSTYSHLQSSSSLISKQADGLGLSGMVVFNTELMDADSMLIATSNGLNKLHFSDNKIEQIELLPQVQNNQVKDIHKDSNGHFWIASSKGLHKYNPKTNKVANYLNTEGNRWGLTGSDLYTVVVDYDDNIWLTGFVGVALAKFSPEKGITDRLLADPLHLYTSGGNYTTDKLISQNRDLWLATTDGLYRVNPQSGQEQHIRLGNNNRENIRTSSIIEDSNGDFWVTTQGAGLAKLTVSDDNKVDLRHFTTRQGLLSNELLNVSIYQDKLWLTTINQLFSYDINTQKSTVYPSLFKIPGLNFEGASQTLVGNTLYIGSNKGLVIVNLDQIESNQYNTPVQITQIKSGDRTLIQGLDSNYQKKSIVSLENNNLSFSYAALDFTNPSANRYRYFLQGSDKNWIEAGNRTEVTYNNLSPGTYTFKVTASNSDGKWSDQVSVFTFEIEQSWLFYALLSLAALLMLALLLFVINRRTHIKTLYQKANYDSLTGLANRYHFNLYIEELVAKADSTFSLIIVDLDEFKDVNDIYGHAVGDELLIQATARMRKVLRDNDLLVRLGGDEFAIIISQHSQSAGLLNVTERLRQTLENHYKLTNHVVRASASIGVASFPSDTSNRDLLQIYADTAMFAAKQSGRNSVRFFNESLSDELEKRTELRHKLQKAIDNEEFELYYQPQIDQFLNQITGFEALIRWFQPNGTAIGPNIFIPEAERNGSIVEIGRWVLSSACKQAAIWHQQGHFTGKVSVNVSAAQITKSDLVSDVEKALHENNLSPEFLELEITESVLVDNIEFTLDILNRLRSLGVSIALDDFGTGYSSLNYLTKFPIDTLKIDGSFVQSVEIDTPTKMVLKNIYTLAEDLSMKVVAEGVETEAQLQILASFQGRIIQGFYFSKAVSAEDASTLLDNYYNN